MQVKANEQSSSQVNTVSGRPHSKGKGKRTAQGRGRGNKPGKPSSGSQETKVRGCFRCNYTDHIARDQNCPGRGKKCNACGDIGHFAVCCKTKERKPFTRDDERRNNHTQGRAYQLSEDSTTGQQDYYALQLELKDPIEVIRMFVSEIVCEISGISCVDEFAVVKGPGRPLLGKNTGENLGVLRVGPDVYSLTAEVSDIREKYKEIFTGVGKLKNFQLKLHIKDDVKPVAQPVQRLPFGLRAKVDEKLNELLAKHIIEEVSHNPTEWVLPLIVVPKTDGDIWISVDMHRENSAIERERHPIPTIEEVLYDLNGSTVFSKLDLKCGFHQVELDERSREITFVTHHLMFGVTSAPEKYQKIMADVLHGCEGVANVADDLTVHGCGIKQHDRNLHALLTCLKEKGLINKCHDLSRQGVAPSEEKVAAILKASPPQDASQVRSFVQLVQYSAKFLPNFVGDCNTRIIADAGPQGLGAVLTQLQDGEWRAISYVSMNLTEVERRYSQTEKEALTLVWACERFNIYVYGRKFELETDHKPFECIFGRLSKPSARIERWVLRLQGYDYREAVTEESLPVALTVKQVGLASDSDPELASLRQYILSGDWSQCKMTAYVCVEDELCVLSKLVLHGTRIVVPKALWGEVLHLAHEGHQGIVKMKAHLRTEVWWPKIDSDAERMCKSCRGCQVVGQFQVPEPMKRVKPPTGPWQDIAIDLKGPLPTGESLLVVVDYYSRFYEVNGHVERQNRTLLKSLKVARVKGKNWREELQKFLLAYRTTSQTSTGVTPAFLMFGSELKTKLLELKCPGNLLDEGVTDRDWNHKLIHKEHADNKREYRWNSALVKRYNPPGKLLEATEAISQDASNTLPLEENITTSRPRRTVRMPEKYKDYVLYELNSVDTLDLC
ncbi:Transposon Ty3-I Gag-Pol polyprotein [Stylophora pistillata]|uniref:Transposon Ty3-I Gag-Pol polyprotein n=1 Tax=Stylophora pistillata TaxID=50429 RepID=A0A2B4S0J5_STYPI|nr:Transposon Ty3-I Gag-Pol polyprotein [Stylophora pistillata]